MSQRPSETARLSVSPLEDRNAPASVSTTTAARGLVFELKGGATSELTTGTGDAKTVTKVNSVVNARGTILYASPTEGLSGSVLVDGVGAGTVKVGSNAPGNVTNTFTGQVVVRDTGGTWTTDQGFVGTVVQAGPDASTSGSKNVGPVDFTAQFDPSTYSVTASWNDAANGKGSFQGLITQPGIGQTDLTITDVTSNFPADGSGASVSFGVEATGALMKAASESAAAATVTGKWEVAADPQNPSATTMVSEFSVPVAWNAGAVSVNVTGLKPPAGAKALVIAVDGDNKVAEADEANNVARVTVTGPTGGAIDPVPGVPPTSPPATPPTAPPPATTLARFGISADGRNRVQWIGSNGSVMGEVAPFGDSYRGPINIASADFSRDGVPDVAVTAGTGGGPQVILFDGATKGVLGSFYAFDPGFRGGVNLSVGDVNGDGTSDIVTGAGSGGGPVVNVFSGRTQELMSQFYAFDPSFRGGVNLAVADLDGNGTAEVVTGSGVGGGSVVNVFDGRYGSVAYSYLAGSGNDRGGVAVSVITGADGKPAIKAVPGRTPPMVVTTGGAAFALPDLPIARPGGLVSLPL